MKKILITLLVSLALFSCSSKKEHKPADKIRKEINKYKSEIKTLEKKIAGLEKQLDTVGGEQTAGNAVAVKVLKIKNQPFRHYFTATGSVEAKNEAYISPQTNGQITHIYVEEGDVVKKGQLLAKLNTEIIEKNIDEVKINLELAKTLYKKQKELWNKKIGSELQYLQAKNKYFSLQSRLQTLQSQYAFSFIKSPLDGVVDKVYQKVGEMGTPGLRLIHVVSLSPLVLKAKVSERYLPDIKVGDSVLVTFPTFKNMQIKAVINRIGYVINSANRTFDVEINIDNSDHTIKPNMMAVLSLRDYETNAAIVVPSYLLREDIKGRYIYIAVREAGVLTATKRYVTTGLSYKGNTEIKSGISEGTIIITDGYNNVSDGVAIGVK